MVLFYDASQANKVERIRKFSAKFESFCGFIIIAFVGSVELAECRSESGPKCRSKRIAKLSAKFGSVFGSIIIAFVGSVELAECRSESGAEFISV